MNDKDLYRMYTYGDNDVYVNNVNDVGVVANGDYDVNDNDDDHQYHRHHQNDRRGDDAR